MDSGLASNSCAVSAGAVCLQALDHESPLAVRLTALDIPVQNCTSKAARTNKATTVSMPAVGGAASLSSCSIQLLLASNSVCSEGNCCTVSCLGTADTAPLAEAVSG